MVAENFFNRNGFAQIVVVRGRAVRVDIVDFLRLETGAFKGKLHTFRLVFAVGRGRGDMVRVVVPAVADNFRVNVRAASLSVLKLFQHDHSSAFAHYKAAAVFVKRARRVRGIVVVVGTKRLH